VTDLPAITRVVTGHDDDGRAVIVDVGPLRNVVELSAIPGTVFHEIWATEGMPTPVDNGPDPTVGPLTLPPPRNGTRLRIVDIPPDTEGLLRQGVDRLSKAFEEIGDPSAATARADSPHPMMHRTESVDYGVVLEGELTLVLDQGEVPLKPGHVVIQRGTNHAWANRSGGVCRMLFVLIDGRFAPGIWREVST
jgi:mannose-6-phosphate isomerase-like protein (cupin superfamily)